MTSKLAGVAVLMVVCLSACAAEVSHHASTLAPYVTAIAASPTLVTATNEPSAPLSTAAMAAPADLTNLPAAPWSGPPMSANEAPRQIWSAWENAANRDVCAPLATRTPGRAAGARARTSELSGGWLVEFDRPGLPGIDRQGHECDTCGRSVFGIAGTSVAPDSLLDADSDVLTPSYSDGSHAETEVTDADGERVASVTFTVNGQGCVYEVWSLLGPDHLAEIVAGLRFVEQPAVRNGALASASN